jgi:hypothetical protein
MRIDVTQEDIDNGEMFKFTDCPIARAVRRETGMHAWVSNRMVSIRNPETDVSEPPLKMINLPPVAVDFIIRFDANQPVTPICFEL